MLARNVSIHDLCINNLTKLVIPFIHHQWKHIGGKLKWISSGQNIVWGVNSANNIYFRYGITASNPVGLGWRHVGGKLSQVDTFGLSVWGVNTNQDAFSMDFKENAGEY